MSNIDITNFDIFVSPVKSIIIEAKTMGKVTLPCGRQRRSVKIETV